MVKRGDKNTKFFHKMDNEHKRYNNIDELVIQGELSHDPAKNEGEIVDFYKKLYTETTNWRPAYTVANCPG